MQIKNRETNEIISLTYLIDGCDQLPDLIGNTTHQDIVWDETEEIYIADDQASIDWWQTYIDNDLQTRQDFAALAEELNISQEIIEEVYLSGLPVDMEDERGVAIWAMDRVREQYAHISTAQAAEILDVKRITIIKWCQNGKIDGARKIGRDWIIPRQSLDGIEKGPSRWDN